MAGAGAPRLPTVSLHADEINELIGEEFAPLLNKAGGAGFQVTAYTQTWSDVEARILGLVLIAVPYWRRRAADSGVAAATGAADVAGALTGVGWRRVVFAALLVFSLVLPSDWTQDLPARYGKRHEGVTHSAIYPRLDASPQQAPVEVRPLSGSRLSGPSPIRSLVRA